MAEEFINSRNCITFCSRNDMDKSKLMRADVLVVRFCIDVSAAPIDICLSYGLRVATNTNLYNNCVLCVMCNRNTCG